MPETLVGLDASFAEAFGNVLEGARLRHSLTIQEVARRAGLQAEEVAMIERGEREPELSRLVDLAVAIGVSPLWLLEEALAWHVAWNAAPDLGLARVREERMHTIGWVIVLAITTGSHGGRRALPAIAERFVDQLTQRGLMIAELHGRATISH